MFGQQLLHPSRTLTALALESFIADATAQGENYPFYQLLAHPNINTLTPNTKAILLLFSHFDYLHYIQNRAAYPQLNARQVYTLRKVTILDLLEGKESANLRSLQQKLHLQQQELIDMLIRLRIEGSIEVKIDEEKATIRISNCEKRKAKILQQQETAMKAKIQLNQERVQILYSYISKVKNGLLGASSNEKKNEPIEIESEI